MSGSSHFLCMSRHTSLGLSELYFSAPLVAPLLWEISQPEGARSSRNTHYPTSFTYSHKRQSVPGTFQCSGETEQNRHEFLPSWCLYSKMSLLSFLSKISSHLILPGKERLREMLLHQQGLIFFSQFFFSSPFFFFIYSSLIFFILILFLKM